MTADRSKNRRRTAIRRSVRLLDITIAKKLVLTAAYDRLLRARENRLYKYRNNTFATASEGVMETSPGSVENSYREVLRLQRPQRQHLRHLQNSWEGHH